MSQWRCAIATNSSPSIQGLSAWTRYWQTALWVLIASIAGLIVLTQPVTVSLPILFLAGMLVLALISPLVVLIAMLVLAPLRTLIATESSVQLPFLDIGQWLVLAFIAFWIVYQIAHKQRVIRFKWSAVLIPLIVFLIGTGLSAFSADVLSAWINEWLKWVIMLVLVIFVLNIEQQWEWLLFALVLAGTANAIVGIYIFLGGSGADHLLINERFFRAFGTFGQPNPFGGFMGLTAPLAIMATLGYAWRFYKRLRQPETASLEAFIQMSFYSIASLLIVTGLFVSWSRGAWLGFAVAIFVIAFALPRKFWQSVLFFGVIAGFSLVMWVSGLLPASIVNRIESSTAEYFVLYDVRGVDISSENYAVVERLAHWQAALNMAQDNPFFGVGFGGYETSYPQYQLVNWDEPLGHAHNYYLNILGEAGIFGLISYLILWGGIFWLTWKARAHPDTLSRFIAIGLLGAWAYLAFHSLLDNLYVNNLFLHLGVMLGMVAILYNQCFHPFVLRFYDTNTTVKIRD